MRAFTSLFYRIWSPLLTGLLYTIAAPVATNFGGDRQKNDEDTTKCDR